MKWAYLCIGFRKMALGYMETKKPFGPSSYTFQPFQKSLLQQYKEYAKVAEKENKSILLFFHKTWRQE